MSSYDVIELSNFSSINVVTFLKIIAIFLEKLVTFAILHCFYTCALFWNYSFRNFVWKNFVNVCLLAQFPIASFPLN